MDTSTLVVVSRLGSVLLVIAIIYPYTIYPAILWLLASWRPRPWAREKFLPPVSVLIAAHNEQAVIKQKMENTLALEYPPERLEVIVASDCSEDATDRLVESFAPRVKLVRLVERSGKQIALNRAAESATGEILIFTDASVNLAPQSARNLVRNFVDPRVGAVSSVIRITREGPDRFPVAEETKNDDAEGAYLGLDIATRASEALVNSAVGCCGSCYAVRRSAFVPFHPTACNDFASAIDSVALGFRVVVDREAVGFMLPAKTVEGEFRRKARTIAGGLGTLAVARRWPSLTGHAVFWWCIVSHKIVRWLGPVLAVGLLLSLLVGTIAGDRAQAIPLVVLVSGLAVGAIGLGVPGLRMIRPVRLATFGLVSMLAAFEGWRMFLTGNLPATWKPTERVDALPQS